MSHASREGTPSAQSRSKHGSDPTLQVICLASGGGPSEDNVTGFLVRSLTTKWSKQSVLALDAGSHLASITRLLESDFPLVSEPEPTAHASHAPHANGSNSKPPTRPHSPTASNSSFSSRSTSPERSHDRTLSAGPFADLSFPFHTARANALHIVREYVSTYLITHPHLDHIAAFAMNTAAFHATSRPKRLAALPSTINAIKTHIFNDVIWPNLTDEDGGVGFVTFQRLTEGGNPAVGEGRGKGYMEVCDGLCVKGMKISHGHCTHGFSSGLPTQATDSGLSEAPPQQSYSRARNNSMAVGSNATGNDAQISPTTTRSDPTPSLTQLSVSGGSSAPASDRTPSVTASALVVDSTAFFIRESATPHHELLVFGDVEPDALSMNPRNAAVWSEAAPKIASGHLRAVVIECSYDDSQGDAVLFGHLCPRHLIKELQVLAGMVRMRQAERRRSRKRKRHSSHFHGVTRSKGTGTHGTGTADTTRAPSMEPETYASVQASEGEDGGGVELDGAKRPRHSLPANTSGSAPFSTTPSNMPAASTFPPSFATSTSAPYDEPSPLPLSGITVLINHVKDSMKDGPLVGDTILWQLKEHEARLRETDGVGLGCTFEVSKRGGCYYF